MMNCPYCAEEIKGDEVACPHCRSSLGVQVQKQMASDSEEPRQEPDPIKEGQTANEVRRGDEEFPPSVPTPTTEKKGETSWSIKKVILLVTAIGCILVLILVGLAQINTKQRKPSDAQECVHEALNLVLQNKYEELINDYMDPEDVKSILQETTMENVVQGMANGKSGYLLDMLARTVGQDPEYNSDNTEATYYFNTLGVPESQTPNPLRLRKTDGIWYIRNH